MRGITSVFDVADRQLCSGCGACAYAEPDAVRLIDIPEHGIRPVPAGAVPTRTPDALRVCPGISLRHDGVPATADRDAFAMWGPILEIWEGHAADEQVRWSASSGGAATALALHCVEHEGMHGVLHVAARDDVPYLNRTLLSRSREELLAATGSRYAPASPCDSLELIERAPEPCVFIGKPCDVAGARNATELRPALAAKMGLTIAMFCAGTPSTNGTLEMIRRMGIAEPASVRSVRYRGNGWPGLAVAATADAEHAMSYDEAWGDILQKHRPWRCHICPDHTGEFADIAVGDPWYREIAPGEPGSSLILVRTERGRRILAAAQAAGVIVATPSDVSILAASQPNLARVRGAVWGRTAAMRALMIPTPRYRNVPTFPAWRQLGAREKLASIVGTLRRVRRRRLYRSARIVPRGPARADPSRETSG